MDNETIDTRSQLFNEGWLAQFLRFADHKFQIRCVVLGIYLVYTCVAMLVGLPIHGGASNFYTKKDNPKNNEILLIWSGASKGALYNSTTIASQ
jgi:hypothetical protein